MSDILKDAERLVKYVDTLIETGKRFITEPSDSIPPTAGMFIGDSEEWKPNTQYVRNNLFVYQGMTGYVKQAKLTSQDIFPPFSTGTEALYGARPKPDADGVYPYVYNMGIFKDMLVRDEGVVYKSITGTYENPTELLFHPKDVPAMLTPVEEGGGGDPSDPEDPADEYPEWVQPTGAHDAYALGAKITHNGKRYISQIPNNTTEPGTDERWWKEVE